MTPDGLIALAVIAVMFVALFFEVLEPDVVVFSSLGALFLLGILTPQEAFIGFSNKGMLTVGILFIVACSAQASGILELLASRMMGSRVGLRRPMLRMMLPSSSSVQREFWPLFICLPHF